jgi:predicted ATPase
VLRGSAVIGVRWEDGAPFDADGPGTSDLDLTLVGGDMLKLWSDDAFYIPKLHTAPLNDDTPESCPSLVPLRRALCKIAGRAVNIQATASLVQYVRDVLFDQPYFTLIDADENRKKSTDESAREVRA